MMSTLRYNTDIGSDNELSDLFPRDICSNMPNIKKLYLYGNQLEGQIPPNIWKCTHLEVLALSGNHFSGNIPFEIGKLSMLRELYLGFNDFQGIYIHLFGRPIISELFPCFSKKLHY